jgi:glycosyltransferase involved in cell wall biosynthesis
MDVSAAAPTPADDASVWVVVPAYREAAVIGEVMAGLRGRFRNVLVVDDGSPDDTGERARAAGAQVMRHAVNLGQGAALRTGIAQALRLGAEVIVTFDADGQHRPEDAWQLVEAVRAGRCDVALGSRFLGSTVGMPASRRWLLKSAVWLTRLLYGVRLTDAHNGLRALSADAARRIRIRHNGMAHASEIVHEALRLRLRVLELPVVIVYSGYSLAKGQKMSNSLAIVADLLTRRLDR